MKNFEDFEYEIKTIVSANPDDSERKEVSVKKYRGNKTEVVIPDEIEGYPVTELDYTFSMQEKLESVTLPKKLETIGIKTFMGCQNLKTIHFPSSLKKIESYAFKNCTSLEEITVSENMDSIEQLELCQLAFENCPKLCDENGFIILRTLLLAYQGSESQVKIPDGITKIGDSAFWDNRIVTSIVMSDSVTIVGKRAFHQCFNLTDINLSKEIKSMRMGAFGNCKKLEQIILSEYVIEIEEEVFYNCESLKEIHWNKGLERILDSAFSRCNSLEEISFPENLNLIGKSFSGCKKLRKITIPSSVDTLYKKAFEKCDSLEFIEILDRPEGTKELDLPMSCFPYSAKMRENVLKKGIDVPEIIAKTFTKAQTKQYLTDLFMSWDKISEESKDIFRREWEKKITAKVKKGKNSLRNMVFLESTGKEMSIYFNEGFHLQLPELEEYLEFSIKNENTIETALLLDYKNKTFDKGYLEEIETRKEMLEIGLEMPTLKELREKWSVKVSKEYITITGYKGKNTHEVIPEAIDTGLPIRYLSTTKTFLENSSYNPIEHLVLPENLENIENRCFNYSTLKEVILPKSMTEISVSMFSGASYLQKIILPEGIKNIEENAFGSCSRLEEIQLPDSLEIIGIAAFCNSLYLVEICFPKKIKKVSERAFSGCYKLEKVILENETTLDIIDPTAFENCKNLKFIGTKNGENLLTIFRKL